jgi:hypothetical protein
VIATNGDSITVTPVSLCRTARERVRYPGGKPPRTSLTGDEERIVEIDGWVGYLKVLYVRLRTIEIIGKVLLSDPYLLAICSENILE